MSITAASILCLSSVIHHEARGEPFKGQVAVAQVVLNRVKSPHFPNTICKVVKQRKQFSWYPKKKLTNAKSKMARKIIKGHHTNPIGNSLYFSSNNVFLGQRLTYKIGKHKFYE